MRCGGAGPGGNYHVPGWRCRRDYFEGFLKLLRSKTRAFVSINDHEYYITHTDGYWRVQDCETLNDKGHFTDCSELVNTVCEVVELPWICGKSLHDSFAGATVYEAVAA